MSKRINDQPDKKPLYNNNLLHIYNFLDRYIDNIRLTNRYIYMIYHIYINKTHYLGIKAKYIYI